MVIRSIYVVWSLVLVGQELPFEKMKDKNVELDILHIERDKIKNKNIPDKIILASTKDKDAENDVEIV